MRLLLYLTLVFASAVVGCRADPTANNEAGDLEDNAVQASSVNAPALPTVSEPLSRRDLLLAAAEAASDHSARVDDTEQQRALNGEPFSFAIRFCEGDADEAVFRSSFDQQSRVLRLEVRPDIDASSPPVQQLGLAEFEAVEGFWIRRPWLLDAACPAVVPTTQAPEAGATDRSNSQAVEPFTPALPWVGIAEFHEAGSHRSSRRGKRPFEVTKRLPEGTRIGHVDLLLRGRLRALPNGSVIACKGGSPAMRPICIISVRIDSVSLRQPGGEVLAEWSGA